MLNYDELLKLHTYCLTRFQYQSDITTYGVREHWPLYEEIPDTGVFIDDCDGFMQLFRKELDKLGEKSVMQAVGINSYKMNHAVCRYGDWILSNTHDKPIKRSDVPHWRFIKHSDYSETGEKWYETI